MDCRATYIVPFTVARDSLTYGEYWTTAPPRTVTANFKFESEKLCIGGKLLAPARVLLASEVECLLLLIDSLG